MRQLEELTDDEASAFDVGRDLEGLTTRSLSTESLIDSLELFRRRYKSSTLLRTNSTLTSFCRWLVNRGHLDVNPFDDDVLHVRHRSEPEVRAFTSEDIDGMLDAAEKPAVGATSAWAARDVAMVDVLAYAGVRAGECCAWQVGDIGSTDRPILHIRRGAKGDKRREVPFPRPHH